MADQTTTRLLEPSEADLEDIEKSLKPVLEQLEETKTRIASLTSPPPTTAAQKDVEDLLDAHHVYHSNAIEGNSLTSSETEDAIRGATIDGRSLKDVLEAKNLQWALKESRKLARSGARMDEAALLKLHEMVLRDIQPGEAGAYRKKPRVIAGSPIEPPDHVLIPDYMAEFWSWLETSQKYHPVVRAAIAHWWLVRIHPFYDGNGRVARLLMYFLLSQAGYRLGPVVLKEDRQVYYDLLARADQGDLESFCEFIAQAVLRSARQFERQLTAQQRSKEALGEVLGKVKASVDRQQLLLYEIWKLGMEAVRSEFSRVGEEVTRALDGQIAVDVRDYGILSFGEWKNLAVGKPVGDRWFFELKVTKPAGFARYVFWFSPTPDLPRRALQLGPTIGLNVSRRTPSDWIRLSGPGRPHLRHVLLKGGEYYQHVWVDEVNRGKIEPVRPVDARTLAADFVQEVLETEFS